MLTIEDIYQHYLEYMSAAQIKHRVVLKRQRQLHTLTVNEFSRIWSNMPDAEQAVWSSKFKHGYAVASEETLQLISNMVSVTPRRAA